MINSEDNHEIEMNFIPNGDSQPIPEEGIKGLRWVLRPKFLYPFIVILLIIIVVLGILYGRSHHPTSCPTSLPTDWIGYNEEWYYFSEEERNWTSSESFCTQHNASLAIINTELQKFMAPFKTKYVYWIGLRRDPGQDWKWTNGEIYRMEVIGPDGGDCAYLNDEFKPSTSRCSQEHRWICSTLKSGKNR